MLSRSTVALTAARRCVPARESLVRVATKAPSSQVVSSPASQSRSLFFSSRSRAEAAKAASDVSSGVAAGAQGVASVAHGQAGGSGGNRKGGANKVGFFTKLKRGFYVVVLGTGATLAYCE